VIRRHALQPANGDRFGFDAPTATGGLARAIADATEDAGKDVGFSVDEISVRELTQRDEPDVLRDVGVCRTGPLTIDDAMKVVGISGVGRFHRSGAPCNRCAPFIDDATCTIRVRSLYRTTRRD
jgi:hypothetical protein